MTNFFDISIWDETSRDRYVVIRNTARYGLSAKVSAFLEANRKYFVRMSDGPARTCHAIERKRMPAFIAWAERHGLSAGYVGRHENLSSAGWGREVSA
jgi:hypothetical protein